jgi:predicted TIM-barrel fold metal-dependent hydrolase
MDDATAPYLVISTDSHAGPWLIEDLREYCPRQHLRDFDDYAVAVRSETSAHLGNDVATNAMSMLTAGAQEALARTVACAGQRNPEARRHDMDQDGVAVDVIFAGGQNDEPLPFVGDGFHAGPPSGTLRAVGHQIWNRWLADFISGTPHRHVGVMQIPIWDIDAALREIRWGYGAGLRAVNFPAPRPDYAPYTDRVYEPLWSLVEELDLPLVTHSASGEKSGVTGPGATSIVEAETHWFSRRALWHLIFGGVFERHPLLKLVFSEQRVAWVPETLRDLDSIYFNDITRDRHYETGELTELTQILPVPPSRYFDRHCYLAGSFMAPFEVAMRDQVGLDNLMWGSDYPHVEGTWPRTRLALRYTFHDVPVNEVRAILGLNAARVFNLDVAALQEVADRIGPTPAEIARAVEPAELPLYRGYAFRTVGTYA